MKRKGTNDEENKIKNIDNKTNINERLVEDDNDDATSIDYDGSQKGSVRSSGRNRGNIENKEENNIEGENIDQVEVEVEVERSSRKKKTGQFKDVMRRSRSFSFSQKMVNKNSEEKIDYNDSININNNSNIDNNIIHSNIMTENINNNNINTNRSIIFKSPSTIEYSSSLLASTIPEGKLKLRAINSDDRLKWVTWLASAIQAQK